MLVENVTDITNDTHQPIDLSKVEKPARIAIYDDFISEPRVIEIEGGPTRDFIGKLSAEIYNQASLKGGQIAYSVLKQVTENLIHAYFQEIVVSIMPGGNEIKFSDRGPGIADKINAQRPGFSSANIEMKKYIDGVGSGLPIVNEYLQTKQGHLIIEDNLNGGTVVTLSLNREISPTNSKKINESLKLNSRQISILKEFSLKEIQGIKSLHDSLNISNSTISKDLSYLEENGVVEHIGTQRKLTSKGKKILSTI